MSRNWARGSTRQWRRTRAQVLARDGYECRNQVPGVCTRRATCVHHTLGRGVSGDDVRYLVASCEPCNLAIGDPTKREPEPKRITRW